MTGAQPGATRLLRLCADDFGQSPAISAGIAALAEAGRLSAVSCIVNGPHWTATAPLLERLPQDVGLHFTLTEGVPLSAALRRHWPRLPGLLRLMALAQLRLLPAAALREEFAAQHAAFVSVAGREPAHLDGHQHVHALPIVRDIVVEAGLALQPRPALRNTGRVLGPGFGFKRALIEGSGGRGLERELRRAGLEHNRVLLGVYDFADADYRGLMQRWLALLPASGGLIFCHPGEASNDDAPDPIAAARPREFAYLQSDAFAADLREAGVTLVRGG
jgi:predicted glycoside hydrolase/deacetylase ChbG (UPF0249 family)